MKYMKNSFIKYPSHYLDPPPLPQEDLEPSKDAKVGIELSLSINLFKSICLFVSLCLTISLTTTIMSVKEDDKNDPSKGKLEDSLDPMTGLNGGKRAQQAAMMMKQRGNRSIISPTGTGMSQAGCQIVT